MLPPHVFAGVDTALVDPNISPKNDPGNFLFLNLQDCSTKYRIPPNRRMRVKREKLREVLMEDLKTHIHWGKRLVDVEQTAGAQGSTAIFADGTRYKGCLIVGIEGSASVVRKILCPDSHDLQQLPIRFAGTSAVLTKEQVQPLRDLDPLLFQGCHPETGTFFWFSILSTPSSEASGTTCSDSRSKNDNYLVQLNLSWPVHSEADELAPTHAARVMEMHRRAEPFDPRLRTAISYIPAEAEILEIKLADWGCLDWDNHGGTVTLAGDAAHAMTMYRGEAANHGIMDAFELSEALDDVYNGNVGLSQAISVYEATMRERVRPAVQLSRQACLDAHDWARLDETSALLTRRAIIAK